MKSELTFHWSLTGIDKSKGFCFSEEIPIRKVPGVFYPSGNESAICAFNPQTGETLTVKEFNTVSNHCSWYYKTTLGWTLVKDYQLVGKVWVVTPDPAPISTESDEDDYDDYWG